MGRELGVDEVFAEAKRLASSAWIEVLLFLGVTVGISTLVDINDLGGGASLVVSIASLALGYVMTVAMLQKGGLFQHGKLGGFGTYFGLGMISGLGVVFGLVLLIIPGIILWIRWLPAYGFALGTERGVTDSLGKSWEVTQLHFWQLLIVALIPIGLSSGGIALSYVALDTMEVPSVFALFVANVAMMGSTVLSTAIGLASYSLLRDAQETLSEVFV